MPRVSEKAERERRRFIAAAQKEFLLKGFDKATIKDITDRLNVAKGSFYYYFKSKEEILVAVSEDMVKDEVIDLKQICEAHEQPVTWRMEKTFDRMFETLFENEPVWKHIHQDLALHNQVSSTVKSMITPFIMNLLKEGNDKGIFKVPYPEEIAGIMFFVADWCVGQYCSTTDESQRERLLGALEHTLGLILGEAAGRFSPMKRHKDSIAGQD